MGGGAGQESRAAVGRPVGLWYGLTGSSPMTDGDRKSSVPEPMRFGAGVKQLTQRQRGAASMGVWGPVLSCRTWTCSLSALSRTVATGRVWPLSNGALRVWLVCRAWVT